MIIYNAEIHTMNENRDIIENGWIEIEDKKIKAVCPGNPIEIVNTDINAGGRSIYPGFIDAHTHLGLFASGVGKEGEDVNEVSEPCTPQLRVLDAINPMDHSFEEARNAGITTALVAPGSANLIAGSVAAIKTNGRRVDKMLVGTVGMKFSLGENPKMTYLSKGASPMTRMASASMIREELKKASDYNDAIQESIVNGTKKPKYDAHCEALQPVIKREIKAHFHCHRADDIFTAMRIANEFNLDYVLVHCSEGYLIADELAAEKASCIVGPMINDRCKPELTNLTPENAAVLSKAGVPVAICTDHNETPIEYLSMSAAIAVKNGLDREKAIEAITSAAANISGVSHRVGSLKKGLDADLVMFDGDPLDIMSSPVLVMIEGETIINKM